MNCLQRASKTLVLTLGLSSVWSCKGGTPSLDDARISAPLGALPIRAFFQALPGAAGAVSTVDVFEKPSGAPATWELVTRQDGTGRLDLMARGAGVSSPLSRAPAFYANMAAVETDHLLLACANELRGAFRGKGPRGDVYSYDDQQPAGVACWAKGGAGESWSELPLSDPSFPRAALWLVGMSLGEGGSVAVATLRDSERDLGRMIRAGRPAEDQSLTWTIGLDATGRPAVQQVVAEPYPDLTGGIEALLPVSCEGACGYLFNGLRYLDCGGCSEGACRDNTCAQQTCSAQAPGAACEPDEQGNAPCGERYDGCQGKLACPQCPSGTVCGGSGDPLHCARLPLLASADKVRDEYGDSAHQLCGTLADDKRGESLVLGESCPFAGQACVHNLCTPLHAPDLDAGTDSGPP